MIKCLVFTFVLNASSEFYNVQRFETICNVYNFSTFIRFAFDLNRALHVHITKFTRDIVKIILNTCSFQFLL